MGKKSISVHSAIQNDVQNNVNNELAPVNHPLSLRIIVGEVVSNKMDKTIVVKIVRKVMHKLYKKYIRCTSKLYAHDPENLAKIGDVVEICSVRPLSKLKHWKLIKVRSKNNAHQESVSQESV